MCCQSTCARLIINYSNNNNNQPEETPKNFPQRKFPSVQLGSSQTRQQRRKTSNVKKEKLHCSIVCVRVCECECGGRCVGRQNWLVLVAPPRRVFLCFKVCFFLHRASSISSSLTTGFHQFPKQKKNRNSLTPVGSPTDHVTEPTAIKEMNLSSENHD